MKHDHRFLIIGVIASLCLLAVFLLFQWNDSPVLQLPAQWLWVALVPVLISIFAGGYISKVKAGSSGVELETIPLRGAPEDIRKGEKVGVTNEGVGGLPPAKEIEGLLIKKDYPDSIAEDLYLIHQSSVTIPRTSQQHGLYRVRIWLESYNPSVLDKIERVSYRLYNDEFPKSVVATSARANNFELWLNVYGEFTVIAYVEIPNRKGLWLTRYLDLPGRPPE